MTNGFNSISTTRRRLLVLGSTGLLGQEVLRQGSANGWSVAGVARSGADFEADIRDAAALSDILQQIAPDVVVNCAALVDFAVCERSPGLAYEVNARPAALLADWSREGGLLVHVSTDHFFGGTGPRRNSEDAPVVLVNEYARSKYAGERFALTSEHCLVLRTSIVGIGGREQKSFAEWAIAAIEGGEPVTLFSDAFTSSIDTPTFARALFELIESGARGLLNLAAREVYSKEQFILEIARQMGAKVNGRTGTVPQSEIRRARALGLDVSRASRLLSEPLTTLPEVVSSILHQYSERGRPCSTEPTSR